ncbi:putative histone-lysine N-methyltransferase ATXR4 [Cocos nucifera]|uniref:Putative histone-lysine N-methyltransferase ATXR4 n=1 Tax=Cocos nucifera TaxID=13894 RepID=A0A8K0I1T0_COCNU|nr:putative histone-lysine N-methyltransferase ATXR4 [Cocos nucifera]
MFLDRAVTSRRWTSSELRRLRRRTLNPPVAASLSTTATYSTTAANVRNPAARSGPPPIRVALTESAGRGVFATRKIGTGELIHSAQPLVTYPSYSLLHKVCYYCLRKLGQESSRSYYFCSEDCRENSKKVLFCV